MILKSERDGEKTFSPDTASVKEPYSHIIGFQLTAAGYRNENKGESQQEVGREKERDRRMGAEGDSGRGGRGGDVDSVTHRTTKHFTI